MSKGKLSRWLDRFLFGGEVPPACRPLPDSLLVPVLFANGRDDDLPALKAFFENRPVVIDGAMLPPDVGYVLHSRTICLSCIAVEMQHHGKTIGFNGFPPPFPVPGKVAQINICHGVKREVVRCVLAYGLAVQP